MLSGSGGKLSKSLLRAAPDSPAHTGVQDWMLTTDKWPGTVDNYADALLWLVSGLIADPKHFYRSFTTTELGTLMAQRPADLATRERAREMPIYKRYFDLIAAGTKTIATREQQLASIRLIYPAEKEALGVIAIEVERV